jgi:multiple sugar transport system ATP-binding protein
MRAEIARIQRDLSVTTIYVTHDQSEAMTLGDRVAVMRRGELLQLAPPQALYSEPVNLFVAEFIGSPAMNLVEATVDDGHARMGPHRLTIDGARPGLAAYKGKRVAIGIRPEDLEDAAVADETREDAILDAVVDIREDMGSEVFVHFGIDATPVSTEDVREAAEEAAIEPERRQYVARVSRESRAREGDPVRLAVRTDRLHFFDLESGARIA